MVRRLSMLLGFIFLISLTARAQDHVEIFGGYTFERYGGTPGRNLNGWEIEGKYKVAPWLGLAADMDGHYGLPVSTGCSDTSFHGRAADFLPGQNFSLLPCSGRGRASPG